MVAQTTATFPNGQTIDNLYFRNSPHSAQLNFRFLPPGKQVVAQTKDRSQQQVNFQRPLYWKIGLAVDDVDDCLRTGLGKKNAKAEQFLNVGYLEHIADPVGFPIELLQTSFEGNTATKKKRIERAEEKLQSSGLRARNPLTRMLDPVIGQVTTRTKDANLCVKFYTEVLGMTLLEKQEVSPYNFDLYFFAYLTDEMKQKVPDFSKIGTMESKIQAQREWLYQLPVTTLEIQHMRNMDKTAPVLAGPDDLSPEKPAFESISIGVSPAQFRKISTSPTFDPVLRCVRDPDGLVVQLTILESKMGSGHGVVSHGVHAHAVAMTGVVDEEERKNKAKASGTSTTKSPRLTRTNSGGGGSTSALARSNSGSPASIKPSNTTGGFSPKARPSAAAMMSTSATTAGNSSSNLLPGPSSENKKLLDKSNGRQTWSEVQRVDIEPLKSVPKGSPRPHYTQANKFAEKFDKEQSHPTLKLIQFPCLSDNYGYLLYVPEQLEPTSTSGTTTTNNSSPPRNNSRRVSQTSQAARVIAIDLPQGHGLEYCQRAKEEFGSVITDVLITHWHWDHLGAWNEIAADNFKANNNHRPRMYASRIELPNLKKFAEESDFSELCKHGEHLNLGPLDFEIIHVPGHTLGQIGFFLKSYGIVFTGDIVFPMGCGRLFEGDAADCYRALKQRLMDHIPKSTLIYCAHEYATDGCQFALALVEKSDQSRQAVIDRCKKIVDLRKDKIPTVPFTAEEELLTSPFLRVQQFSKKLGESKEEDIFRQLRSVRNDFKCSKPWRMADFEKTLQSGERWSDGESSPKGLKPAAKH
ncbi:unnamed protein product [Amoebophrya sp. A120]|nr:unnamed protein product [Amoebophrya sp. A120]|eukprot:GSA120T00016207001.1